jgi:dihydroorotate dehydrogenase (NAD+) catalytic subunit
MVYECANAVSIPIIGMGGIATAEDAIEFMLAGATGVAVGMMNFVNPYATEEVVKGIEDYMIRHNIDDINTIIGAVH